METSQENVDEYFSSYNDVTVHELMLKDRPRTLAYKQFFEENREYIVDKVVMDVGSGTGILAMFAAAAGAKKVYAVEASEMAAICKNIVVCNGFEEKIEVINKKVEDVDLVNDEKVDILVSEWMGFYLLHESMLDSVIFARDKFLKPNGIMVPSHANLLIAPVNMDNYYDDHFEYWSNCYGFDLSPMVPAAMATSFREPLITEVSEKQLVAQSDFVTAFDLKTVTVDDVQHLSKSCEFLVNDACTIHGFVTWFNVVFTCLNSDGQSSNESSSIQLLNGEADTQSDPVVSLPITLSTGPSAEATHWKQTVIFLTSALEVEKDSSLPCLVELSQDKDNKRHYNISIDLTGNEDDIEAETNDHPIPCDCSAPRCKLIKTVMEKFAEEQDEVETEAENTETNAEIEAARVLDSETISDVSI
ncbi:hypothetical protein SNE40_021679 [Patella caerulea]|uniref:type I protein arginine methyltransferase n=1 Tax=Patella caerulea TaxID=87958 RepID=A0AAN8IX02_PATCE